MPCRLLPARRACAVTRTQRSACVSIWLVIKQFEPEEAKHFAEEAWGEMGMALAESKSFQVNIDKGHWEKEFNHWSGGYLYVQIGERRWCGNRGFDRFKPGAPEVEALCKALQEIAPMDCVGSFDNRLQDRP
jgi:hypothetical protein